MLAAAVRPNAAAISTFNTSDFPPESVGPFALELVDPATLLLDQLDLALGPVTDELEQQTAANRRSPTTLSALVHSLTRAGIARLE